MSDDARVSVAIGERNGDGRRHVTFRHRGQPEYSDTIDLETAWKRERSLQSGSSILRVVG